MKIGIDIRPLRDTMTGIGRYLYKLLEELSICDTENQYRLFYSNIKGNRPAGLPRSANMEVLSYRWPGKMITALWAYSQFPVAETFLGDIDVFHAPCFQVPPVRNCATVFTIHDLIPITNPELAIPSAIRHFRPRIKHYARRADIIVAISRATASDIVENLGVQEDKIEVLYQGTTMLQKATTEEVGALREKFGLDRDYILFVGRIEPRKNLPRVLKAFEISGLYRDLDLVLAGPPGWHMSQFNEAFNFLSCRDSVRILDYVQDRDLAALYSGARLFVFASLKEGFGLPILEAMSVGCPVLTSNCSSMPEVAGDAALYVDPFDIDSISNGLLKIANDSELRSRLSRSGKERVAEFTWEKTAEKMIQIYRRAYEMRRS